MADSKATQLRPVKFCSRRYGWVLLAGGLLAIQDFSFAYQGMGHRLQAYNEEFMKSNFEAYHQMVIQRDAPVPKAGYPDTGAGLYARQLPYKDWYKQNIF